MERPTETFRIACQACVAAGESTIGFAAFDESALEKYLATVCPVCGWWPADFVAVMEMFDAVSLEEAIHFAEVPWRVLGLRIGRHLEGGDPGDPHGTVERLREEYVAGALRKRPGAETFAARRNWQGFLLLFSSGFRQFAFEMLISALSPSATERSVAVAAAKELGLSDAAALAEEE
jgi:hypothetical protein